MDYVIHLCRVHIMNKSHFNTKLILIIKMLENHDALLFIMCFSFMSYLEYQYTQGYNNKTYLTYTFSVSGQLIKNQLTHITIGQLTQILGQLTQVFSQLTHIFGQLIHVFSHKITKWSVSFVCWVLI